MPPGELRPPGGGADSSWSWSRRSAVFRASSTREAPASRCTRARHLRRAAPPLFARTLREPGGRLRERRRSNYHSLGCVPRTSSPRHHASCHDAAGLMQEVLRAILANAGFLDRFKEWAQLRGTVPDARKVGIFLHLKITSDRLFDSRATSSSSPGRWAFFHDR